MANIQGLVEKYKNIDKERFFHDIFEKKEYEPILSRKMDVVLDIGALAGEFSAYIYDKAQVIYCIEAFPPYYKELTDNITEFGLDKMKPFNFALAGFNGEVRFTSDSVRGGNAMTRELEDSIVVPCKSLATFMREQGIEHVDVLKIDIEGGEDEVFFAKDFLEVIDKIDCIIGEHISAELHGFFENHGLKKTIINDANVIYERI